MNIDSCSLIKRLMIFGPRLCLVVVIKIRIISVRRSRREEIEIYEG